MGEDLPLVSIVTPSYNQGRFIEDTILSVKNQDYPNIEHIVIDGGSLDNTVQILKKHEGKYNLKWISEPDEGQSDALNKGFGMAKGQIIGWLNSDDVYFGKDTISYIVKLFLENPDTDVVYGDDMFIDSENNLFKARIFLNWSYSKILRGFSISQPATFFRNNVLIANHLNSDLHFAMDFEFWLRLGKNHSFKHANRILAGNRIHKGRKTISGAQESKLETRLVMQNYGARFDSKYYLLRYLIDLPYFQINKVLGAITILRIQRDLKDLAFRGKYKNTLTLVLKQIVPVAWLKSLF